LVELIGTQSAFDQSSGSCKGSIATGERDFLLFLLLQCVMQTGDFSEAKKFPTFEVAQLRLAPISLKQR
jgi:hypothetical protein